MYENTWKNNKNKYQFKIPSSFFPSEVYINLFNDDNRRQSDPRYIDDKKKIDKNRLYNLL
jgi:hypothetical protein